MEKNKNTLGICKLCGEERELCDSHIFSKFIFKYMAIINHRQSRWYEEGP